jgi:hypothetical protein
MILPIRRTSTLTLMLWLSTVATALAADPAYEVKPTLAKATVGTKATASVTITTKNGWHLNAEAPITLKLAPGSEISVEKQRLLRADLAASSENSARFDVALVAAKAGTGEIAAEAGFVICQDTLCRPIKEKLVIGVDANTLSAPAASKASTKSRKK